MALLYYYFLIKMKNYIVILSITMVFGVSAVFAQAPVADFSMNAERCQGQEITFTSISTPPDSITKEFWDFGTGNPEDTASGTVVKFAYLGAGNKTISLTVTDRAGMTHTDSSIIFIDPTPVPAILYDIPCMPDNVTFIDNSTLSNGSIENYNWNIKSVNDDSAIFTYTQALTADTHNITLTVTSNKGCMASITETFDYGDKPDVTFNPTGPRKVCQGEAIKLTASGGASYMWSDSTTGPSKNVISGGWYTVTAFRGNNCNDVDSIQVIRVAKPTADAGEDQTITIGQKAILAGSGGTNYTWSPPETVDDEFSPNTTATPTTSTTYILSVSDANGCSATDSVRITVVLTTSVPVHNMITPNGDGYNDKWDLSALPNIETADIHVFNRWGWEVYKSEAYKHDWQGTFNNEPLPDGTYIYVIQFANPNQETLKGALEILRNTQK
jgi:gliding motility-associated-like protein